MYAGLANISLPPGILFTKRLNLAHLLDALPEDSAHETMIGELLEYGADIKVCTVNRESLLHLAHVSSPRLEQLLKYGSNVLDVNARDHRGRTPLHYAAAAGVAAAMHSLLRHGADIGARDDTGGTPLHYAKGSLESIKCALNEGADVNAVDNLDGLYCTTVNLCGAVRNQR